MNNVFKIIDIVIKYKGAVYGGFVRDMLANRPFNDIDIWFKCLEDKLKFETQLQAEYQCSITSVEWENDKYFSPADHSKIIILDEKFGFTLDVLVIDTDSFFTKHKPDVNVNRLYISKDGIKTYCTSYSAFDIIKSIKNNHITPEINCKSIKKRVGKLLDKGWEMNPELLIKEIIE